MKKLTIALIAFMSFIIGCSEEQNKNTSKIDNNQPILVTKNCTYEQVYIDQQTQEYIDVSNAFIAAHRTQSSLQGLAKIQNFSLYTQAYQRFARKHYMMGEIANSEVCKEQVINLIDVINQVNAFIRAEKGKIRF
jgi:hypothetical protein